MDKIKILEILYYLAGAGYGDNTIWETIAKLNFTESDILDALAEHEYYNSTGAACLRLAEDIISRICRLEG